MAHRAWNRDGIRRLRNHPYSAVQQVAGGFASGMEGLVGDANDAARFTQAFFRENNLNTQPTDYKLTKELRNEIRKYEQQLVEEKSNKRRTAGRRHKTPATWILPRRDAKHGPIVYRPAM